MENKIKDLEKAYEIISEFNFVNFYDEDGEPLEDVMKDNSELLEEISNALISIDYIIDKLKTLKNK